MVGFGRDAIELDDFEPVAGTKGLEPAADAHVESAEIEPIEPLRDRVEALFERPREHPSSIEKHGAAAMRAQFHQRERFPVRWHARQLVAVAVAIQPCGAHRPIVVEYQLLERAPAVARDGREFLFGDREDVPVRL